MTLAQLFVLPKLEVLVRTQAPDMVLLERLEEAMWDSIPPARMLRLIHAGELDAWETPNGLILLETVDWSRGRELCIYGMVGRDILVPGMVEAIIRDLKRIAAYKGCSMIGGVGVPMAWKRAAPRLGFKPVSTHYVMEL